MQVLTVKEMLGNGGLEDLPESDNAGEPIGMNGHVVELAVLGEDPVRIAVRNDELRAAIWNVNAKAKNGGTRRRDHARLRGAMLTAAPRRAKTLMRTPTCSGERLGLELNVYRNSAARGAATRQGHKGGS